LGRRPSTTDHTFTAAGARAHCGTLGAARDFAAGEVGAVGAVLGEAHAAGVAEVDSADRRHRPPRAPVGGLAGQAGEADQGAAAVTPDAVAGLPDVDVGHVRGR